MSYVETYYRTRLPADRARPALSDQREADVCVIGGGLAGLSAAHDLVRAGRSVVVLEARRVAWGASGRNGGFVSPGYSIGHADIVRTVGEESARALHRLSIEGVDIVRANIAELRIDAAEPVTGYLSASRRPAAEELRAQRDRMERDFGTAIEFWPRERVRESLVSARYHEGLYQPDAFHFDPLAYAAALAAEIERLGGAVFEGSAVTSLTRDGAARAASTAQGRVRARDMIVATGGYTGPLVKRLRAAYLPIATYVMLTRPHPDLIATAIRTDAAIGDRRRAGDYYRVVDGGRRILWGGKITTRTSEPRDLAEQLRQSMVSAYPQLANLGVDLAWTGLMAYARHMMPQIARLEDGLWCCTAFGGHGMNTTAIGGRVVAEAITGQTDRHRLFAPFGLAWNGGVFGRAAVQATYWSLQLQDAMAERGGA